jgi:hypothetical protein
VAGSTPTTRPPRSRGTAKNERTRGYGEVDQVGSEHATGSKHASHLGDEGSGGERLGNHAVV